MSTLQLFFSATLCGTSIFPDANWYLANESGYSQVLTVTKAKVLLDRIHQVIEVNMVLVQ